MRTLWRGARKILREGTFYTSRPQVRLRSYANGSRLICRPLAAESSRNNEPNNFQSSSYVLYYVKYQWSKLELYTFPTVKQIIQCVKDFLFDPKNNNRTLVHYIFFMTFLVFSATRWIYKSSYLFHWSH